MINNNLIAVTIFSLFFFPSCSQQVITIVGEVKYGTSDGELQHNENIESGPFYYIIPEDIEVDYENNIYLIDRNKNVLKFSPKMDFIFTKKLSDTQIAFNRSFSKIDLETDSKGNLYVLSSSEDYLKNMLKFDKNGNPVSDFRLSRQPWHRIIDLFISKNNRIYINTFPVSPADIKYINDGLVFVYDLDGNFLGRTDYFIEDNEGNGYYRNLLNNSQLQVDVYKIGSQINKPAESEKVGELKIDHSEIKAWHFIGTDNQKNVYMAQRNDENTLIRVFNYHENKIRDIEIKKDELNNAGILFGLVSFNNISIAPDGSIILCGIKTDETSLHHIFSLKDVIIAVVRITDEE